MSQLVELTIQNVKNISNAVIQPGKFNQITGPNSQGKTAVLQSVEFLMSGSMDVGLIKVGEEKATVIGKWDDGLQVTRYLKAREGQKPTTDVKVEQNGMVPKAKQAFLNGMLGVGSFDPREILNPKTRDQFIMQMIDVQITKKDLNAALKPWDVTLPELNYEQNALQVIDAAQAHFFALRTERNRETKAAKVRAEDAKKAVPARPELLTDMSEPELISRKDALAEEFKGLKQKVSDWEEKSEAIKQSKQNLSESKSQIKNLQEQIDRMTEMLNKETDNHDMLCDSIRESEKNLGKKPDIMAETERITNEGQKFAEEIQRHRTIESVEREEAAAQSLKQAFEAAKGKSDALDAAVNALRGPVRADVMSKADLPIKGLEYSDGRFTLAGRSLDLLSGSEALIIGLQLTRKKNPETNVICIDGGECLDDETYQNLQRAVADDGFNYFLTKVGSAFDSQTDTVIEMKKGEPVQ